MSDNAFVTSEKNGVKQHTDDAWCKDRDLRG